MLGAAVTSSELTSPSTTYQNISANILSFFPVAVKYLELGTCQRRDIPTHLQCFGSLGSLKL